MAWTVDFLQKMSWDMKESNSKKMLSAGIAITTTKKILKFFKNSKDKLSNLKETKNTATYDKTQDICITTTIKIYMTRI